MPTRLAAMVALALSFATVSASSQQPTPDSVRQPNGWMAGVALGVPGSREGTVPGLFTLGGTFTQLHLNHLGADISIGTMPYLVSLGVVPIGARLGAALPIVVVPHLLVSPSGGLSIIGLAGPGGATGVIGGNIGVSTVLYAGPVGLKTGMSWHGFTSTQGTVWLFEVGVVHVPVGLP